MSENERANLTDDRLVEEIRKWSIERWKCGLDAERANRINDKELIPYRDILAARGLPALRKLLPLLEDENPSVRLNAAAFAFEADPEICRAAFQKLIGEGGFTALLAWAVWSHQEPETAPDPTTFLPQ